MKSISKPAVRNQIKPFVRTLRQVMASELLVKAAHALMYGGARSGKTFLAVRGLFMRAMKAPNSNHLAVRKHLSHARTSLWHKTIRDVHRICFPGLDLHYNKQEMFITFPNGSRIWVGGTDDAERVEKILGNEYSTILIEEASQVSWDVVSVLETRLAENVGLVNKMWYTCNPPTKNHWLYKLFILLQNPSTRNALANPDDYKSILMNPIDNINNLPPQFLTRLANLPDERKRKRFMDGLFLDVVEGALFEESWITLNRVKYKTLLELKKDVLILKVAIGVDPAVTSKIGTSDETGIIAVAQGWVDGVTEYYVLADATGTYKPLDWGLAVKNLAEKLDADYVVCETNQGGELVTQNLRTAGYGGLIKTVHARVAKHIRAEPVAALYQLNRVHHLFDSGLNKVDDCLIEYIPLLTTESPDRLDALVMGITSFEDNRGTAQAVAETDYDEVAKLMNQMNQRLGG